jgi:Flp pilus assembly protein TadG
MLDAAQRAVGSPREGGAVLVEFALSAPLLLILLAGVLNYGFALVKATAVANAARIGAQFGSSSPSQTTNTSGIQTAAVNSAPNFSGLTVTSAQVCKCSNGSAVSCSGTCSSGKVRMYVQVNISASSSALFPYPGVPYTGSIAAQAMMRAQ